MMGTQLSLKGIVMFLDRLLTSNPALAELAFEWHRQGIIEPDTYVLDLDAIAQNARAMQNEASEYGITLYYMLKQIGRNPLIAQAVEGAGFRGAVCVDWREALVMARAGMHLGNVGHLVQTPVSVLPEIVAAKPDIMTVYSIEKARQIGEVAAKLEFKQPIMLRVLGPSDTLYSGQYGGFRIEELRPVIEELEKIPGVRIAGVCSFPCFLFSEETGDLEALPNIETVHAAASLLEERGYHDLQLNMPSASCVHTIPLVAARGGTHMEPGHSLTGTTPYHVMHDEPERVGYVYVSELSHNLDGGGFCYAGGHYRRGHVEHALMGRSIEQSARVGVVPPDDACIDYHFALSEPGQVGDTVLMCFRAQLFVTRSEVAVVSGLFAGAPKLEGIFNTQGTRLR